MVPAIRGLAMGRFSRAATWMPVLRAQRAPFSTSTATTQLNTQRRVYADLPLSAEKSFSTIIQSPSAAPDENKLFSLPSSPMEPYYIQRTPTRNLPIYQLTKAGGNLRMTRVRKIGGDTEVFRQQLQEFLQPTPEYVRINPINGHVEMKVLVVKSFSHTRADVSWD